MNNADHTTTTPTTFAISQDIPASQYQQPSSVHEMNLPSLREILPDSFTERNPSGQDHVEADREAPHAHRNSRKRNTSELDRVKIKTAAAAGLSTHEIARRYGFTHGQIYYALRNPAQPKATENGGKPAISREKAMELASWIRREPYNRHRLDLRGIRSSKMERV